MVRARAVKGRVVEVVLAIANDPAGHDCPMLCALFEQESTR